MFFGSRERVSCSLDWCGSPTCSWCPLLCYLLVDSWTGEAFPWIFICKRLYQPSVWLRTIHVIQYFISLSYLIQIRRRLLRLVVDEESNAVTILGSNFSAGFVAGTLAAAVTCPLDVAKTRRQIEVNSGFEHFIVILFSH